jgi:hypothetical protein
MMMTKKPSGGAVTLQSSLGDNAHNAAIYAEFRALEAEGKNILDVYTIIVDSNIIVADIWFVEDFYAMHDSGMEISITLRSNGRLIVSYV